MKKVSGFILALLVLGSILIGCESSKSNIIAECENGIFTGAENNGIISWKGIPYAKAPVGELRWKAPEPPEKSDKTFRADSFGKTATQRFLHSELAGKNMVGVGEDCLTLNIWTKDNDIKNKTVMFFIHGGSFAWGGSSDPLYDGTNLVSRHDDVMLGLILQKQEIPVQTGCRG